MPNDPIESKIKKNQMLVSYNLGKPIVRTRYQKIESYQTKDASLIKELMHPNSHGNKNQSLAEAIVPAGTTTILHKHNLSEELYYITKGVGKMTLGKEQFEVNSGDCICILPGTQHCIENTGADDLHILCCCSPAYSHEDTQLI